MLDRFNVSELDAARTAGSDTGLDFDEQWTFCRSCGNRIALLASRSELDGCHLHRRTNPGGIEFEFAIFTQAPGCGTVGGPVEQDSWFRGYTWELAVCAGCAEHLGWRFASRESDCAYGLIVAKLVERGAG